MEVNSLNSNIPGNLWENRDEWRSKLSDQHKKNP